MKSKHYELQFKATRKAVGSRYEALLNEKAEALKPFFDFTAALTSTLEYDVRLDELLVLRQISKKKFVHQILSSKSFSD